MPKRILLTGARGFIGRACVPALLNRGYDVHAVGQGSAPPSAASVRYHRCDILDRRAMAELMRAVAPTHLLHCAWNVTHGVYWTAPDNLDWLCASISLLQEFAAVGGKRAVGVGSCAEYDWTADNPLHETASRLAPSTPYGAAKLATCLAFAAAQALSLSTAWGRLFFPYGPGEKAERLIPGVISGILRGSPVDCTLGTQVRDFMHIADVAEALVGLVDRDVEGAVNIGTGIGVSLRTVVESIIARLGGAEYVRFGALPMRSGDPSHLVADPTRLQREVGVTPRYSLQQGIDDTVGRWRAAVAGNQ